MPREAGLAKNGSQRLDEPASLVYRALLMNVFSPFLRWVPAMMLAVSTAAPAAQPFHEGDVVGFVGDSITRGGGYHSNVQLFYALRHPEFALRCYNVGRSGDTAGGTLKRLDWELLVHKPTAATLMLGMNDIGHDFYAPGATDDQAEARMRATVDKIAGPYEQLVGTLEKAGARLTLLGPSIYDDTAQIDKPADKGKNKALGLWAARVKEIADRHHADFVDFHAPMTALNLAGQKKDPKSTLVGADRIHPGPVGHFIMAYLLLKAQGHSPFVAKAGVDAAGKTLEAVNCELTEVKAQGGGVSFQYLAKALPFPVDAAAAPVLALVPFTTDLNQELLTIKGLGAGWYTLLIDDQPVGDYAAEALEAGINLATNPKTPQYQQALRVAKANEERHRIESSDMRGIAFVRASVLDPVKADMNDAAAVQAAFEAYAAKHPDPKDFGRAMINLWPRWMAGREKNEAAVAAAIHTMQTENQPKPHRVVVKRVK